jgi:hypothetical protein
MPVLENGPMTRARLKCQYCGITLEARPQYSFSTKIIINENAYYCNNPACPGEPRGIEY